MSWENFQKDQSSLFYDKNGILSGVLNEPGDPREVWGFLQGIFFEYDLLPANYSSPQEAITDLELLNRFLITGSKHLLAGRRIENAAIDIATHIHQALPKENLADIIDATGVIKEEMQGRVEYYRYQLARQFQEVLGKTAAALQTIFPPPALTELLGQLITECYETAIESDGPDLGTKLLYLKRAIEEKDDTFLISLDKLYSSHLNSIPIIQALKSINDLYFDNHINFGDYGPNRQEGPARVPRTAHWQYFRNFGTVNLEACQRFIKQFIGEHEDKCLLSPLNEPPAPGVGSEQFQRIHEEKYYIQRNPDWRLQLDLRPDQRITKDFRKLAEELNIAWEEMPYIQTTRVEFCLNYRNLPSVKRLINDCNMPVALLSDIPKIQLQGLVLYAKEIALLVKEAKVPFAELNVPCNKNWDILMIFAKAAVQLINGLKVSFSELYNIKNIDLLRLILCHPKKIVEMGIPFERLGELPLEELKSVMGEPIPAPEVTHSPSGLPSANSLRAQYESIAASYNAAAASQAFSTPSITGFGTFLVRQRQGQRQIQRRPEPGNEIEIIPEPRRVGRAALYGTLYGRFWQERLNASDYDVSLPDDNSRPRTQPPSRASSRESSPNPESELRNRGNTA